MATTDWIVLAVRWSVEYFLYFESPNIPEKSRRRKIWNSKAIAKHSLYFTNKRNNNFEEIVFKEEIVSEFRWKVKCIEAT